MERPRTIATENPELREAQDAVRAAVTAAAERPWLPFGEVCGPLTKNCQLTWRYGVYTVDHTAAALRLVLPPISRRHRGSALLVASVTNSVNGFTLVVPSNRMRINGTLESPNILPYGATLIVAVATDQWLAWRLAI